MKNNNIIRIHTTYAKYILGALLMFFININSKSTTNTKSIQSVSTSKTEKIRIKKEFEKIKNLRPDVIKPNIVDTKKNGRDVIYFYADGSALKKSGGTLAWVNNNPGNLVLGDVAKKFGAKISNHGFAVFPTYQDGWDALVYLLHTADYQNLTIEQAILKYANPNAFDYARMVANNCHAQPGTKLQDLTENQINIMARSIKKKEGTVAGKETFIPVIDTTNKTIAMADKMRQRGAN